MNASGLYDLFRSQMGDMALPYLWPDDEVFQYMDDAYKMFVRLTGGIGDITSALTSLSYSAGDKTTPYDRRILRFMSAKRSDATPVQIVNFTDIQNLQVNDYGLIRQINTNTSGPVRYMVIGRQKGIAEWVQIPDAADTISLHIYRLPLVPVVDESHPLDEVDDEHHWHLVKWMKHLAYSKQDAEAYDAKKAADYELAFRNYCGEAKAEWERHKTKTRVTAYAGI